MSPAAEPHRKRTRIQVRNEQRIVDAALDVFSRSGYRGATVEEIAGKAGMSKANVLYYFRRKRDIYLAVLEHTLEVWLDPLEHLDAGGDPAEQLWRYIRIKLQMSKQSPAASRLFANEILHGAPMLHEHLVTHLKPLVQRKCRVLQGWIDSGRLRPVEPLYLLYLIWSATQHYADFATQMDLLSDDDIDARFEKAERTLRTTLLEGLLP